ncbi:MAG: hypothetical protein RBT76_08030 [candidate division Zixibacteria bacterium]|jgi:hypothetical protein|nr:hypothetical protein [candidate division Zixibacteria bacterium]
MKLHRLKKCPRCKEWFSWSSIINDPAIRPLGLNVDPENHEHGYLHFFHAMPTCQTAFVIPTREISPAIIARPQVPRSGRPGSCPGHCTDVVDLTPCGPECSFAPIRRLFLEIFDNDARVGDRALSFELAG